MNHSHPQLLSSLDLLVHFLYHMWPIQCGVWRYIICAYMGARCFAQHIVGYCCRFRHAIYSSRTIFIHYCFSHFHSSLDYSSGCWSSYATTPFMLPLFSHCFFFCLASSPFTLLLLSCCSSCIVLPFPFQAITSQPLLFFSHYHSRSVHIIAVMFSLVSMVLPMPLPCARRSSKARHQLNHQMWILLHIFKIFEIFIIIVA